MKYQINIQGLSEVEVIKILKKIERQYKGVLWYSQRIKRIHLNETVTERYINVRDSKEYCLIYDSEQNYLLKSPSVYNYPYLLLNKDIQTKLK